MTMTWVWDLSETHVISCMLTTSTAFVDAIPSWLLTKVLGLCCFVNRTIWSICDCQMVPCQVTRLPSCPAWCRMVQEHLSLISLIFQSSIGFLNSQSLRQVQTFPTITGDLCAANFRLSYEPSVSAQWPAATIVHLRHGLRVDTSHYASGLWISDTCLQLMPCCEARLLLT